MEKGEAFCAGLTPSRSTSCCTSSRSHARRCPSSSLRSSVRHKPVFWRQFDTKNDQFTKTVRQARDKHRESTLKRDAFFSVESFPKILHQKNPVRDLPIQIAKKHFDPEDVVRGRPYLEERKGKKTESFAKTGSGQTQTQKPSSQTAVRFLLGHLTGLGHGKGSKKTALLSSFSRRK